MDSSHELETLIRNSRPVPNRGMFRTSLEIRNQADAG
jgi:hypothetical protein